MKLTKEQTEILTCAKGIKRGQIIKINAFAGTGKTFILSQIAKSQPYKTFLYLAFNKSIVEESRNKFPPNVTILTTHSLAYREIVGKEDSVRQDYKTIEIAELLNIDFQKAGEALRELNRFFSSSDKEINKKKESGFFAAQIYKMMEDREIDITHSYYLKKFQLLANHGIDKYDFVLLDEAQDTNDVTLDIFLRAKGAKILVGDTHQAIYAFRGAEDAMQKVKADYSLYLSTTFRCCQHVVDRANFVLRNFKGESIPIISSVAGEPTEDTYAVISRTNGKIIEAFAEYDENYKLVKNPGQIFSLPFALSSWLNDKKDDIRPDYEWLKKFKSEAELKDYAEITGDVELASSLSIAKRYGKGLYYFYKNAMIAYRANSGIVLVTGHISKGLEFDKVEIESDFPALEQVFAEGGDGKLNAVEEANLYYVATTRAKWQIDDKSKNNKFFEV